MSVGTLSLRLAMKAVIVNEKNQALILREAGSYQEGTNPGKYSLPGGRVEAGEYFLDGLMREVFEETGLGIADVYPVYMGEWRPIINGVQQQIVAVCFACKLIKGSVVLNKEHDSYSWIDLAEVPNYDILPPYDQAIMATLGNNRIFL